MLNIRKIIAELDNTDRGWDSMFRDIKERSAEIKLSNKVAHLPESRRRNRYRNVSPYDRSRIKLIAGENDYINASLVQIPEINRRYILTQGPLKNTAGQFWQMIWEQQSVAVIMLNKVIENNMEKCYQYWPLDDQTMEFVDEGYTVKVEQQEDKSTFTLRHIQLCNLNENDSRNIYHFHYTTWPDFGVPESPTDFLEFLKNVRQLGVLEDDVGPPILHCSAGIGRSGTFALVDACLVMCEKNIPFDITRTLLSMRNDRMGLIQTYQQLRFSFLAIEEGSRQLLPDEPVSSSPEQSDAEDSTSSESEKEDNGDNEEPENIGNGDHTNLRKRHADNQSDDYGSVKKGKETQSDPVDGISVTQNNNFVSSSLNESELRLREKHDKQKEFAKKVNDIKNKMKESEKKNGQTSWMPYYIIGGISIVAICFAAKYWL